jgi:hypothetical protein
MADQELVARSHEAHLAIDTLAMKSVAHGQRDLDAGGAGTDHGDPESPYSARVRQHPLPAVHELAERTQGQQAIAEALELRSVDFAADV